VRQKVGNIFYTPQLRQISTKFQYSITARNEKVPVYNNSITKDPITLQKCCCITLLNVNVVKAAIENKNSVTTHFNKLTTENNFLC